MASPREALPDRELAALIRRSAILDPAQKRQWLQVLPHLAPRERARLRAILEAPVRTPASGDAGERA